ncbi:DUF5688 family protein [Lachnospiraceae bacterium 46-15]
MKYEEFICRVQARLAEKLGDEVRAERRLIVKNNGVALEGIAIMEEGKKISPVIYLNDYYIVYQKGARFEEIVEDILKVYEKSRVNVSVDSDFYKDFEKVASRVVCKLVNYDRNEELLQRIPHICCLDLALVFYYALEDEEIGSGTILIFNSHLAMWGITRERLYEIARRNTPKIYPYEFREMREILEENFGEMGLVLEDKEEFPMYVLSNAARSFGAVYILYDSVLAEIAEELEDDFYILPSSVHECIIVPSKVQADREELEDMVFEINRTQVLPEDVLSDHVYLYERECHRLSAGCPGGRKIVDN